MNRALSCLASLVPCLVIAGCAAGDAASLPSNAAPPPPPPPSAEGAEPPLQAVALPGAVGPVSVDYIAYDAAHARVWVPVGDTGSVDVLDAAARSFKRVGGFATAERQRHGRTVVAGPSAVTIGDGFAYVADRASSEVCAVDEATLAKGVCVKLAGRTDAAAYVAAVKEVWVTTPHEKAIVVLDATAPATLAPKTTFTLPGSPESCAVDATNGLFYTNLEDKDETVAIDVHTHAVRSTWQTGCGGEGPRGIRVDGANGLVFVACTDRVLVLDAARAGAKLSEIATGPGVDDIDWVPGLRLLFIAAGKAGKLTVAHVGERGDVAVKATHSIVLGARNAVAAPNGAAFVVDAADAMLLLL
jgi:DNA-binding beta-propeller fold protein YncE